ncbi:MarR family winged helix-turn-helix transcriptional regulator [Roseiterribacter gracilis]|uniref:Transcriptional regulator n=1 Tax=Roseiterribacter gracilis TaxID=2812848 RepID=A0A8S8X603_9PROT|nr:transcriptional regulator [Rhodospirillales bacterium TMPK1]
MLNLDQFLPYQLNVLASRVSNELAQVYAERFGLSIAEWRVIAHLANNHEVSVRDIQRRVDMDKSKVSRAAAHLEETGLIRKRVNAQDRRLIKLALTPKGAKIFEQIVPLALAYETQFLGALTRSEAALFRTVIERLLAATSATEANDED